MRLLRLCLPVITTLLFLAGYSQTITIDGAQTSNSNSIGPVYSTTSAPKSLRSASIYPQSLLSTMSSGATITALQFYKHSTGSLPSGNRLRIYLMNASSNNWGSGNLDWATTAAAATLVFDGDPSGYIDATAGWKAFTLNTPYTYTGSHLAVLFEYEQTTAPGSAINWRHQTSANQPAYVNNSTKSANADAIPPPALTSSTANHLFIKIDYNTSVCTSPPTAGDAVKKPELSVCPNTNVVLDVKNQTIGSGQTYRWMSCNTENGTYTYVSAASAEKSLTVAPSVTTYYKAELTCGGQKSETLPIAVEVNQKLNGAYTINAGQPTAARNFQSFGAFTNAVKCGVSGPVTVDVQNGPFNEMVVFPAIPDASATNTITINGNGNTIKFTCDENYRQVVTLNGTDYLTLNNLVIDGSASGYGWGILLTGDASYNVISNCTITVDKTVTSTSRTEGIILSNSLTSPISSGNNGSNNLITGNTITGGQYGIVLYGSSTAGAQNLNNSVINNIIRDVYDNGIHVLYQSGAVIRGNDISRPTRTNVTTAAGVMLSTGNLNVTVENNVVHNMFDAAGGTTTTCYGIYVSAAGTAALPNRIINNLVYNLNNNGAQYGIYNKGGAFMEAYHNTISLDYSGSTSGATYGFYQSDEASGIVFKNNIVSITRGGDGVKYGIYKNTATVALTSNSNVYFINSSGSGVQSIGYQSLAFPTLADWSAATGQDIRSVTADPEFVIPVSGYKPTSARINNLGEALGVTLDIDGASRHTTTPDPGAYEFSLPPCPATITPGTVVAPSLVCSSTSFTLDLSNNSTGSGQVYQWQYSADNVNWNALGSAADITARPTTQLQSYYYRAAITCNGGTTAYTPSVLVNSPALVSGNFTINNNLPTGAGNFTSFSDAVEYIRCGINGPVVFEVVPGSGPYYEQIIMPAIAGASAINTITIKGNGASLVHYTSSASNRYAVLFNGADYVTIDSLEIDVASGAYGWGVVLMNAADNNTIRRCYIRLNETVKTRPNFAGIVINGSTSDMDIEGNNGSNNLIEYNRIRGGYMSVHLKGHSTIINSGNTVRNNQFEEMLVYAVNAEQNHNLTVSGNDISRPTRSDLSTTWAIDIAASTGVLVEKNRIHDLFNAAPTSTQTLYTIYLDGPGNSPAQPNRIQNNVVYNIKNGGGGAYGIWSTGANTVIYHNTILLDDVAATATGEFSFNSGIYASGADVHVRNNVIYITKGGNGSPKSCVNYSTTGVASSDYNVFYIDLAAGTRNYITQYNNVNYTSMATWKAANSGKYDQNSIFADPNFTNASSGDLIPVNALLDNLCAGVGVTTDIAGVTRQAQPDPGALEFSAGIDQRPPTIKFTPLGYSCSTGDRVLSGVNIVDGGQIPTAGNTVPRIYYKKIAASTWFSSAGSLQSGTASNGMWSFTISSTDLGGVALGDSIQYFIVAQDVAGNVISDQADVLASDVNTISSYAASPLVYPISTMGGTYTVGVAGQFENLTKAIDKFNNSCLSGPVVLELTDQYYSEPGEITIAKHPESSAAKTLTIRPSTGVNASVRTSAAGRSLLRIMGSYIIVDGSNNGSNTRNLTLANSSSSSPVVLNLGSAGTNAVSFVTVKNTVVVNGSNSSNAIVIRDTLGREGYFNNVTIQHNRIERAYTGIFATAVTSAGNGSIIIADNDLSAASYNAIRNTGVYLSGAANASITGNNIGNFDNTTGENDRGIALDGCTSAVITNNRITNIGYGGSGAYGASGIIIGQTSSGTTITDNTVSEIVSSGSSQATGITIGSGDVTGTIIRRNKVSAIRNLNIEGYGAYGLWLASGSATAASKIDHNYLHDITGYGKSAVPNNGHGIFISAGAGYTIVFNTVVMDSSQVSSAGVSAALTINNTVSANGAIDLRNNILCNWQSKGSLYAVYSASPNTIFSGIDHNNYYSAGAALGFIGSTRADIAGMQSGFGGNVNSVSLKPVFTATGDYHIDPPFNLALDNKGVTIPGYTTDFDGEARSATSPDIGADEFTSYAGTDLGLNTIADPVQKGCHSAAETVAVFVRNYSAAVHDFAVSPMTINASTSGVNPVTFSPVTVNSGILAPGNSIRIIVSASYDMTNAGTYTFNASLQVAGDGNASNNVAAPITRTVEVLSAGTATASKTSYCINGGKPVVSLNGTTGINNIQWQESFSSSGPWANVGNNAASYIPSTDITATTYYRAQVSCNANSAFSNLVTVELESPLAFNTAGGFVCTGGIVNLSAAAPPGHTLNWYDQPTGGSVVGTGTAYATPYLLSSTNFYVSALRAGTTTHTGVTAPSSNAVTGGGTTNYGMVFEVLAPFTLKSVDIWPVSTSAGAGQPSTVTIDVIDLAGTVHHTVTANVTGYPYGSAIKHTIDLNFDLLPGVYKMRPGSTGPGISGLLFESRSGSRLDYPYVTPGLLSITTSTYSAAFAPMDELYYYFYNWVISNGCEGPRVPVLASIGTGTSPAAGATGTTECVSSTIAGATTFMYTDCDILGSITPSGGSPVSGTVNACVTIDPAVQSAPTGEPYLQRHFDVAMSSSSATSVMTLYFLQAEFDAFNAARGGYAPLPVNSADAAGIANLRITQYRGTGTAPGNYIGSSVQITPFAVSYNGTAGRWEITFQATGGGGLYLHTGRYVLPVTGLQLSGVANGSRNELKWRTVTESGNTGFDLERSADGIGFSRIASVASAAPGGNSSVPLDYSYTDVYAPAGDVYYRLRQKDQSGNFQFSNVILLSRKTQVLQLQRVYPNPLREELNLTIQAPGNQEITITVTDISGRILVSTRKIVVSGANQLKLNVRPLAAGSYLVKIADVNQTQTITERFVKY